LRMPMSMKKSASAITRSVPVWLAGRCVFELHISFLPLGGCCFHCWRYCWLYHAHAKLLFFFFLLSVLLRSRRAMGYRLKTLSIEMTGKQKRGVINLVSLLFYLYF
jgi:hypothetical protein